eukprot:jgi/Chrzof1/2193/Cz11g05190.t1
MQATVLLLVALASLFASQVYAQPSSFDAAKLILTPKPGPPGPRTTQVTGASAGSNGITREIVRLGPCTMRTLHTHAATELLYPFVGDVLSGQIYGGKTYTTVISAAKQQSTIYPAGVPHFQFNPSCSAGYAIQVFNTDPAGVKTVNFNAGNTPSSLSNPFNTIMKRGIDPKSNNYFADGSVTTDVECAKKCGMMTTEKSTITINPSRAFVLG